MKTTIATRRTRMIVRRKGLVNRKPLSYIIACVLLLILTNYTFEGFAQDYIELSTPGIAGIGAYYDGMFRGKVNPAAVGYVKESLGFGVVSKATKSNMRSFCAEYNTNRLSISDVRSDLARAKVHFGMDRLEEVYEPSQQIGELLQLTTRFNMDVTKSIRFGVGQQVNHITGLAFKRKDAGKGAKFGNFDIDLTSFAIDLGAAVQLSRHFYLSMYGQNALYFTLGEPSVGQVAGSGIAPEIELRAPLIVGGGPTIALAQLVASLDIFYLSNIGDPPGLRGTAFYTLFLANERFRIKLGAGAQTVASSNWLNDFKGEMVASFWTSERLSITYGIYAARSRAGGKGRVHHCAGISWLWE